MFRKCKLAIIPIFKLICELYFFNRSNAIIGRKHHAKIIKIINPIKTNTTSQNSKIDLTISLKDATFCH